METNPFDSYWMEGDSLAPPCQAEMDVVEEIIDLAHPEPYDCLYDLGCGDGRICIEASKKYDCRSVGCEIEEKLVEEFRNGVLSENLEEKVKIIHGDLLDLDLSEATIIVVYLLPDAVDMIKPKLLEALRRGCKLICNTWGPKSSILQPSKRVQCGFCDNVTLLYYDRNSLNE